jgi:predicted alpha-1,2-mannosidase
LLTVTFGALFVYSLSVYNKTSYTVENRSELVDPLIGTDFHGHTYPGATMPFGMVQLSPDTRLDGWDGCSAFHYSDSIIYGFSHTHLSGTGCSDYGDILLMPVNEYNTQISEKKYYTSLFRKETVTAEAGFYSVHLEDFDIDVELTASSRTGFHKYTYPDKNEKYVILDLEHRDEVLEAWVKQISNTRFVGLRRSKAWAKDQYLYFAVDFSQPVEIIDYTPESNSNKAGYFESKKCKLVLKSMSADENELFVKVALSAVNENGAVANLEKEIPGWNFDEIKANAVNAWDNELSKILVYGGTKEQQRTFYTSLYHTFIVPNIYSDVDGSFRGTDLKVYNSKDHDTYTVFSLWDTYRAAHPLYTIIQEKRTLDFIRTFIDHYKYGGQLPVWELASNETQCMIGYHSVPVITDAYFKGIKDFDKELALEAMVASATEDRLGKPEFAKYGFIPMDLEHESVSKALEYAYDDWCIAQFAKELGKNDIYRSFSERAQYYKNVLNPENGFMQAKINGAWQTPFDPKEVNYNYTEANSWQYSFYVPHDILTFIELHGGNERFASKIDEMFSEESSTTGTHQVDITGLIGQYAHGNEPSHHIAYLYNYCGKPWKTQELVRKIMKEQYSDKPDGLCGNEDCGQMSAWYVMSALGFYPVNPANGIYDIGSPLFDTAIIRLENNKEFSIIAHNNTDENVYVQSIKLNGKEYNKSYLIHKDIMNGGKLEFFMGSVPNLNRAVLESDIYTSRITEDLISPVPYANYATKSFHDSIYIELKCPDNKAQIFYSINDGEYILYTQPVLLNGNTELKTYAKSPDKNQSKVVVASYKHIPDHRTIKIISQYSPQYSAGGDNALIDFIKGENWFRSGLWQGYQGQDFEAVVDLQEIKDIKNINVTFLQDTRSWIFFPKKVIFYVSNDGINFKEIYKTDSKMSDRDEAINIQEFKYHPESLKARYIKVFGEYYGKLPDWHLSPGYKSWLFIDEIEIE